MSAFVNGAVNPTLRDRIQEVIDRRTVAGKPDEVYEVLAAVPGNGGLTADEIAAVIGCQVKSIRFRIRRLYTAGKIVSKETRPGKAATRAKVWRLP